MVQCRPVMVRWRWRWCLPPRCLVIDLEHTLRLPEIRMVRMVGKLVASELLEPLLWKLFDAAKAQKAIAKEVAEDEDEEDEEDKEDKDSLPTWKTRDDEFPFWIKHISIQSITGIINEQNCAWDPTYFDWFMRVAVRLSIFRSALWSLFWICYRFAMYINFAGHILVLQTILADLAYFCRWSDRRLFGRLYIPHPLLKNDHEEHHMDGKSMVNPCTQTIASLPNTPLEWLKQRV